MNALRSIREGFRSVRGAFRSIHDAFRSELRPARPNPWQKCPGCWHRAAPYDYCHHSSHGSICRTCCPFNGDHPKPKKAEELAELSAQPDQEERDDQQH